MYQTHLSWNAGIRASASVSTVTSTMRAPDAINEGSVFPIA